MKRSAPAAANSPARQLDTLIGRFHPAIRKLVREARAKLRRRLPTAIELVYDNYNALAIGFASSERMSDTIVSLAVYARGVNLYFMYVREPARKPFTYGAALGGSTPPAAAAAVQIVGRFVRLESAAALDRREIDELLAAAIEEGETPLPRSGRGHIVIKSVSPKQRLRRQ